VHRFQPALDLIGRQSAALKAANWGCFPRNFSVIKKPRLWHRAPFLSTAKLGFYGLVARWWRAPPAARRACRWQPGQCRQSARLAAPDAAFELQKITTAKNQKWPIAQKKAGEWMKLKVVQLE